MNRVQIDKELHKVDKGFHTQKKQSSGTPKVNKPLVRSKLEREITTLKRAKNLLSQNPTTIERTFIDNFLTIDCTKVKQLCDKIEAADLEIKTVTRPSSHCPSYRLEKPAVPCKRNGCVSVDKLTITSSIDLKANITDFTNKIGYTFDLVITTFLTILALEITNTVRKLLKNVAIISMYNPTYGVVFINIITLSVASYCIVLAYRHVHTCAKKAHKAYFISNFFPNNQTSEST